MNEKNTYLGIYTAIVTDVSTYKTTGKIKTRISVFNGLYTEKNLLNNYDSEAFAKSLTKDMLTLIASPIGGGNNYGIFKLPPVNSVGLVMFMNGFVNSPVWIATIPNIIMSENGQIVEFDAPTDIDDNRGAMYIEGTDTVFNMEDEKSFVMNLKSNTIDDLSNENTMNWRNNPVENKIVMNSGKMLMKHRISDGSEMLIIAKGENKEDDEVGIKYTSSEFEKNKAIVLGKETVSLKSKSGDYTANITIIDGDSKDPTTMKISVFENTANNNGTGSMIETGITIEPAGMLINSGGSTIELSRNIDTSKEEVAITAKNVRITAENISLGNSGYYFVMTPDPGISITTEDGTLMVSTKKIKA